ncbi:MAG: holo-ACP synthase [Gemmatimonadota bacterium]|nr:holo-ACP synthase [Gemmatimonadota bacterium]MDH3367076.1 holo-ACP synthase [Gemmatimonadota bacterium]MDH3478516.1 holo-ACP synthase [Gemmatimonadota bacterium]MDH3570738.1 holo-ACP synthase [Gemmatimonadota bacterium]MDH5548419.1 holo-ACP synthase [Gemmatimonadota bacterium]
MTVLGLGIDLVDVSRVRRLLDRHGDRALERLLTPDERAYCTTRAVPSVHIAARLAAKEAAFKALAGESDARRIWWTELEVRREGDGRPTLHLHGKASARAERLGVRSSLLSLTHERDHAAAVVLLIG